MNNEITCYSKIEQGMADVKSRHHNVIVDLSTKNGSLLAFSGRSELRQIRTNIEKIRVDEKKHYIDAGKKIDAMAKMLTEMILPMELSYDSAIKAEERRVDEIRIAKQRAADEVIAVRIREEERIKKEAADKIQAEKDLLAEEQRVEIEKRELEVLRQQKEINEAKDKILQEDRIRKAAADEERRKIAAAQDELREKTLRAQREIAAQENASRLKIQAEERQIRIDQQIILDANQKIQDEKIRAENEILAKERAAKDKKEKAEELRKQNKLDGYALLSKFLAKCENDDEFKTVVIFVKQWLETK